VAWQKDEYNINIYNSVTSKNFTNMLLVKSGG